MINNKEKLTQATIAALQNQNDVEFDTKENHKKQLKKLVEEYVADNNLSEFLDICVSLITEEELFNILNQLMHTDNYS